MTVRNDACTLPCKGIYADVRKNSEDLQTKKDYKNVLEKYKKYKTGVNDEGDISFIFSHI